MFNKLEEIIKKTEGNVLTICLDEKLINAFENNNNKINLYSIQSNNSTSAFKKQNKSKMKNNKGKSIKIKKLRKYLNKKSVNYLFCNMNEMFKYYKYFIKDSVYLNNKKLYIYANKEIDKELLINNYKRYNVEIECTDYKNGYIIVVDNTQSKNDFLKDKIYFIKDTFYNIAETIGNILIG